MKKILLSVFVLCILTLAVSLHAKKDTKAAESEFSDSMVHFTINSLPMNWESRARLDKVAGGYTLDVRASDKATNDTLRMLVKLEGDGPWEGVLNSNEMFILFAGRTYRGFVMLHMEPFSKNDERANWRFEPYTLTWAGLDKTITVGEGTVSFTKK